MNRTTLLIAGATAALAAAPAAVAISHSQLRLHIGDETNIAGSRVYCKAARTLGAPTMVCAKLPLKPGGLSVAISDGRVTVTRLSDPAGDNRVVFSLRQR